MKWPRKALSSLFFDIFHFPLSVPIKRLKIFGRHAYLYLFLHCTLVMAEFASVDLSQFSEAEIALFREGFNKVDTDGSGSISTSELGALLTGLGYSVPDDVLPELIKPVDVDNSGSLDFNEFVTLICAFIAMSQDIEESEHVTVSADLSIFSEEEIAGFKAAFGAVGTK